MQGTITFLIPWHSGKGLAEVISRLSWRSQRLHLPTCLQTTPESLSHANTPPEAQNQPQITDFLRNMYSCMSSWHPKQERTILTCIYQKSNISYLHLFFLNHTFLSQPCKFKMTHLDTPCILYQTVSWSCWFVHYGDSCFLQRPLFSSRESPLYSEQYRFASIHAKALTGHLLGHRTLWAPHSVSLWVTALLKTEQSSTSNWLMSWMVRSPFL